MMHIRLRSRSASALLVVLILGIILVIAGLALFSATRESSHQTAISLQGLQCLCLAETALERALADLEAVSVNPGVAVEAIGNKRLLELAYRLRAPAKKGKAPSGTTSDLTCEDNSLEGFDQTPVTLGKQDLRLLPEGQDELDRLVTFMTSGTAKAWDVKVTLQPVECSRIGPPKDDREYEVPGVETTWTIREDVKKFLENGGYVSFSLNLPDSLTLFEFSIPVEIGVMGLSAKLFDINFLSVADKGLELLATNPEWKKRFDEFVPNGGDKGYATSLMTFNTALHIILNKGVFALFCDPSDPPLYNPPLNLSLNHVVFPAIRTLWPSDKPLRLPTGAEAKNYCVEKYGTLRVQVEASITAPDGHVTTRRIDGRKEFRVSDLEPPAPMYSLFIENRPNAWMTFNHIGGELWVNNRNLFREIMQAAAAAGRKVKEGLGFESGKAPVDAEIPGLVRVNFANGDSGPPLVVNTTLMGNPSAPALAVGYDNILFRLVRGFEGLFILDLSCNMTMVGGEKTMRAEFHNPALAAKFLPEKHRPTLTEEDHKWSRSYEKAKTEWSGKFIEIGQAIQEKFTVKKAEEEAAENEKPEAKKPRSDITDWKKIADPEGKIGKEGDGYEKFYQGFKNMFNKVTRLNIMPEMDKVSCNPLEAILCLMAKPLKEKFVDSSSVGEVTKLLSMPDIFQSCESPWFGTEWWLPPLPINWWARGTTHLFGYGAIFPTLTREVEGKVLKKFRQWRLAIIGLEGKDRILMPKPPFFFPPIPIPLFYASAIIDKYGYKFALLQSFDSIKGEPVTTTNEFDPKANENRAPNLYTTVQYAKKASHYYESQEAFLDDLPRRMVDLPDGKKAFLLDGVNYIVGSLGTKDQPFKPATGAEGAPDFLVTGRGMIVCSGNIFLGTNVRMVDRPLGKGGKKEQALFTLMAREGGLILASPAKGRQAYEIEGSVYTDQGLLVHSQCSLRIIGNWVTNMFRKATMQGTVVVDYSSSRVRSSLASLHPETGRFDPARYHLSMSPGWTTWKSE